MATPTSTSTSTELSLSYSSTRCTATELCKAAGSQSLERLRAAVNTGWTAQEMDQLAENVADNNNNNNKNTSNGKTPLQMACWKGCFENVQYLMETVGCQLNVYSKARYSYGKTPIFFALTQSRPNVVQYLLSKKAKVTIVNNKGQSVLSLAASHDMPTCTLRQIQQLELQQQAEHLRATSSSPENNIENNNNNNNNFITSNGWWDFRKAHSDHLEYGDLDPRFFTDRPLHHGDVVSDYAINPTTSASRKGAFARRNPHVLHHHHQQQQQQQQPKKKNARKNKQPTQQTNKSSSSSNANAATVVLSSQEQQSLQLAWKCLEAPPITVIEAIDATNTEAVLKMESLITIIYLEDKQRGPWIPRVMQRLANLHSPVDLLSFLKDTNEHYCCTLQSSSTGYNYSKIGRLLQKMIQKVQQQQQQHKQQHGVSKSDTSNTTIESASTNTKFHMAKQRYKDLLHSPIGIRACQQVAGLSIAAKSLYPLVLHSETELQLSTPPIFVNTIDQLQHLKQKLYHSFAETKNDNDPCMATTQVIGFDAEWYDTCVNDVALATIQLSFLVPNQEMQERTVLSYVIDVMMPTDENNNNEYISRVQEFMRMLFEHKNVLIVGFAMDQDLVLLEKFMGKRKVQAAAPLLDLQLVLAGTRSALPSLKACVDRYSSISLSKEQQCSDWALRPLTKQQLYYAALDAAILLFLLAEYSATSPTQS